MCKEYYETEQYKDYTIRIYPDDNPMSPRDFDNLGTIVCLNHRRYILGDVQTDDIVDYLQSENIAVCLPVYMYEHGNIALSTSDNYPFNDAWDSGCIGAIFVSREKIKQEYNWNRITAERKAKIVEYLKGEIETYSQYLSGDTWGYMIADSNDDEIDACWGFYGYKWCLQEAKDQVDYHCKQDAIEQDKLNERIMQYA